jgi:hypothetical protein
MAAMQSVEPGLVPPKGHVPCTAPSLGCTEDSELARAGRPDSPQSALY